MAAPLPKHTISSSVITKYKHDAAVFVDRDDQQCIEIGPGSVCFFSKLLPWRHKVWIMLRATKINGEFSYKKVRVSLDSLQSWLNPSKLSLITPRSQDIVQRRWLYHRLLAPQLLQLTRPRNLSDSSAAPFTFPRLSITPLQPRGSPCRELMELTNSYYMPPQCWHER